MFLQIVINLLLAVHVLVSLLMVLVVLMQRPKSEGLGAAFGGGMTENLFGAQTTNVLQKFTVYLGGAFFALTLTLAVLFARSSSLNSGAKKGLEQSDPVPAAAVTPAPSASPAVEGTPASSPAVEATASPATPAATESPAVEASPAASPAPAALPEMTPAASPEASATPQASPEASPAATPAESATPAPSPANP